MEMILSLNAGSSSLKFAAYRMRGREEERVFSGAAEEIGGPQGRFWLRGAGTNRLTDRKQQFADHKEALGAVFAAFAAEGVKGFGAAGHRIVHGGPFFSAPEKVDREVRKRLEQLIPFAPLHLPSEIAIVDEVARARPDLPQVVCFDTAFHRSMPEIARRFALPGKLWDEGVLRYGFHGLSYEFVVGKLGRDLGRRAIIAHLGNGASMAALRDGVPADTSMGLTPTGGFMMGTRSGDLDPGVILYLLRRGASEQQLENLLDHESGLLGVSGLTSDMRSLIENRDRHAGAASAVEMFCYQARKFIGAYAAVLGGLDTLVFTAGIGERSSEVRSEICRGLDFLGVALDGGANDHHAEVISRAGSSCTVRVVATDEDLMIARHTERVIGGA
jgi:acetate kinase